jgi:adenosyl cobinamide kinase/adenosyl cobinamide phosphate guanylyltransferase
VSGSSTLESPGFADLSHPEHRDEVAEQLIGIARNIRTWQEAQRPRLSDAQMVRQFSGLGSDKTFRKIREGELESLNVDAQLPKYRGVWAQIEELAGAAAEEEIYDDLQPALHAGAAVAGLIPQRGMTRLVMVVGPTGSGKSRCAELALKKYPGSAHKVEAHEGWQSLNCALGDMLLAVGGVKSADDLPSGSGQRLAAVIAHLKSSRKLLWIDEGHHATAAVLNAIKTILNKTDSVIVIGCIDTLWRKLAARSWEEVKQLFYNRLFELVTLEAPKREDTILFLSRRVSSLQGDGWHSAAPKLAAMAAGQGRFAFLRQVAVKLRESGATGDAAEILQIATNLKASLEFR